MLSTKKWKSYILMEARDGQERQSDACRCANERGLFAVLYTRWNYFKGRFCTDEHTVKLPHYAAELFFRICAELLLRT